MLQRFIIVQQYIPVGKTLFFQSFHNNHHLAQVYQKNPVNIIILHKCTKNRNHMLWGSWHMEYNGCNYFSFWAIFCAFPLLTNQDMKISKNWKKQKEKNLEISSTAWRLSKYSVSSGPYSPTFGLNTERYLSIFPFSVWMRENTD